LRGRSYPSLPIEDCIKEDEGTLSTGIQDERKRGDEHNFLQGKIRMDVREKILIVTIIKIAMDYAEK